MCDGVMESSAFDVIYSCFNSTLFLCIIYTIYRVKYNHLVIAHLECRTLLVLTPCRHLRGCTRRREAHGSLEMSALSGSGIRRKRCGETVVLFKIEIVKEAKLIHDKLLNIQFF